MNKKIDFRLPTITIIIVTKNAERTLPKVLQSIAKQDYPKSHLELLVVDGNSTDNSIRIIQKAKSKLQIRIVKSDFPNDPEACRGVGILQAKHEIIGFVDSDNFMPHKNWLKIMIRPLVAHTEVYGSQSLRYGYRKNDTTLNRYFALIGSADPVGLYLNKADRLSFLYDKWNLYGKIIAEYHNYILVKFTPDHFPTLGCNGFFFKKEKLFTINVNPQNFFHIDTPLDLCKKGIDTYAIVDEEILHDTAGSFSSFLKKRAKYMRLHYQIRSNKRRYKVFDPSKKEDVINLAKFIIYSLTFIQPTFFALRGFIKKKDLVWFIHPIFCFSIMWTYTFMVIMGLIQTHYKSFKK